MKDAKGLLREEIARLRSRERSHVMAAKAYIGMGDHAFAAFELVSAAKVDALAEGLARMVRAGDALPKKRKRVRK